MTRTHENYVSFIKELILHHCQRCAILSETPYCEACKAEIDGDPVMVKVDVQISATSVDAHIAELEGDFTEIAELRHLYWKPTDARRISFFPDGQLIFKKGGDVD